MKMLLASSDVPALQLVAKRLVAAGIPIALCKDSDMSSCPEVWIQRDGDFSLARRLLVEGVESPATTPAPAYRPRSGSAQGNSASRRGGSTGSSRIGRCFRWLHQWQQS